MSLMNGSIELLFSRLMETGLDLGEAMVLEKVSLINRQVWQSTQKTIYSLLTPVMTVSRNTVKMGKCSRNGESMVPERASLICRGVSPLIHKAIFMSPTGVTTESKNSIAQVISFRP